MFDEEIVYVIDAIDEALQNQQEVANVSENGKLRAMHAAMVAKTVLSQPIETIGDEFASQYEQNVFENDNVIEGFCREELWTVHSLANYAIQNINAFAKDLSLVSH